MNTETNGAPVNMNMVMERICNATNNRHFDDVWFIAGIKDLWQACRTYLMRFEIDGLENDDPGTLIDWDTGMPSDWKEYVCWRLAFIGRKYGYVEVTAVVKGVEYKASATDDVCEERT